MAHKGSKNLIQNRETTPEQRRANASKAGKASAEAKKARKTEREKLATLLSLPPANDDDIETLKAFGAQVEGADIYDVILVSLINKARKGDIPAIKEIRNILGTDNAANDIELRKEEAKRRDKELELKIKKIEEEDW